MIIGKDGGLSMWSISDNNREKIPLKREEKKSWWAQMLEKLQKNKKSKGKVAFNAEKRARQLSAANSKNQVRSLINLLQIDLKQCEDGVKNLMCDGDEVKKVQKMIEEAEKILNEVDDKEENFSVNVLI